MRQDTTRFLWGRLIGALGYFLYPKDHYSLYPESDHYSQKTGRFFNPLPDHSMDKLGVISAFWQMMFHSEKFMPNQPLPVQKPNFSEFLAESENAKFIWFGHSSLLARLDGKTVFIDPVFAKSVSPLPWMMRRFQPPPTSLAELPKVDWIVISHNHYDHLDKAVIEHYRHLQNVRFITPLGVGELLKKWGISPERVEQLDWWQARQIGDLTITAVPARHNTGRGIFDRNKTLWAGYVFQTPTEKVYYSGDSAWGDGSQFHQIAEHFGQFDLAFVENGQYNPTWIDNHMLPEQMVEAVKLLQPKRVMPVHWGAYALSIHGWKAPVERAVPLLKQIAMPVLTPQLGQVFDRQTKTEFWWQNVK
ncbi:MAG: MBL fold metallo-hydrolase [Pasteurellaceae bacterium]|nr:MBL fold metallo-hydrolase [Pasteurellaceae bacterium]